MYCNNHFINGGGGSARGGQVRAAINSQHLFHRIEQSTLKQKDDFI